jgi:hypothetical protein
MIPKAKELFDKFCYAIRTEETDSGYFTNVIYAKNCALIAVDEILKTNTLQDRNCGFVTLCEKHKEYWEEVKEEIEKL